MSRAEVQILRDSEGLPSIVNINRKGHNLKVTYNKDRGFIFEGKKIPTVPELLNLIYPANIESVLSVPQPLQVQNISGGKTLLFDDMEGLLKWTGTAAAKDNAHGYNGSNCLSVTCGAAATNEYVYRGFVMSPRRKINFSCYFSFSDITKLNASRYIISCLSEREIITAQIQYDHTNRTINYRDKDGVFKVISSVIGLNSVDTRNAFHKIDFDVDINSRTYGSMTLDDMTYDINKECSHSAFGSLTYSYVGFQVDNVAGQEVIGYYDDVLIIEL